MQSMDSTYGDYRRPQSLASGMNVMAAAIAKTGKASTKIDQLEVIQNLLNSAAPPSFATLISRHGSELARDERPAWTVPPAHSAEANSLAA
jgi:hypothetical protein